MSSVQVAEVVDIMTNRTVVAHPPLDALEAATKNHQFTIAIPPTDTNEATEEVITLEVLMIRRLPGGFVHIDGNAMLHDACEQVRIFLNPGSPEDPGWVHFINL